MSDHSDNSKPRGYRFPAGVPATILVGGRSVPCAAENVSRTGALLIGRFAEPVAERLDLILKSQNGTLEIRLAGQVVRSDADPTTGELHLAVEFVDLDAGKRDAVEIFLSRILESPVPAPLEGLKPGASPHDVKKVLESIPLPLRIGMAQRAELRHREILRQDQHPAVLESLVRNSSLTLPEARVIATSQFLQSGTIDLLSNDLRFRRDDELRMAIATHARVSPATAERVTADFEGPKLRKLLAKPGINQLLREKLLKKLPRA